MTVEEVRERIAAIARLNGYDEAQHSRADSLYEAVLEAIANGSPDPAAVAREALTVDNLDFARWCA